MSDRGPSVLIAVVTERGLRRADDGASFVVEGIGNAMSIDPAEFPPDGMMIVPVYVMAVAGRANRSVRLGLVLEYPDGMRAPFAATDATKHVATAGGAVEWHARLEFPFRGPGQHWVRVSLNSALRTEIPLNVTLIESGDETAVSGVRYDA